MVETRDTWDVITFVNNTPSGIDWKRIVLTNDLEVGKLRGGSANIYDPEKYAPPSWLTLSKATELWKLHTGKSKQFETKKDAQMAFWKYFYNKAKQVKDEDLSITRLVSTPEKPKRSLASDLVKQAKTKVSPLLENNKIKPTGKQPKSEKNAARLKLYKNQTVKQIIEKHPDIKMGDIKYDLRCGYAEIVG